MADVFEALANRIRVTRNGHSVFDTSLRSVALFPASTKLIYSGGIAYPEPYKGNAYNRDTVGAGARGRSFITLLKQEWGYNRTDNTAINHRFLDQTLIGTVPSGTDYLDVQANLTRAATPSNDVAGVPPFVMIPQGQVVSLQGGSCIIERSGFFVRLFEVVLVGTSVYLRRYQSVGSETIPWLAGNSDTSSSGWTHGGASNNPGSSPETCLLATRLDTRGPSPTGFDRRRANNNDRANIPGRPTIAPGTSTAGATYVDPTVFASTFTGTLTVHPGRINN